MIDLQAPDLNVPEAERGDKQDPSSLKLSHVRAALTRLPDHHREVLVLVSASGFDYEEVSRILGCPLGTVKSRLSRARKSLEAILTSRNEQASADSDGGAEPEEPTSERAENMPSEEIH